MTERSPIPLSAAPIRLDSPEFATLLSWPYADPFVSRMLQTDITERFLSGDCQVWVYRDPVGQRTVHELERPEGRSTRNAQFVHGPAFLCPHPISSAAASTE